jgi:acetyl esterase
MLRLVGRAAPARISRKEWMMPLDPQVQALLDELASRDAKSRNDMTIAEARAAALDAMEFHGAPEAVAGISEREIPGPTSPIKARIYRPFGDGPFPVLMFFHGGGWVICSLDTHDGLARRLANHAGCVVVSVDYRLAPEHPFPAAVDDCHAATCWVAAHASEFDGDPKRLAVAGDSAGGNLATAVALLARDAGGPALKHQLLIYPVTAHYSLGTASYEAFSEGYFLDKADMIWFWDHYLPHAEAPIDERAAPLGARSLAGLPPATIVTAEYDPLRDEAEQYAARLQAAGVPVTLLRYDGMIHAFMTLVGAIDRGRLAIDEVVSSLRASFEI